MEEKLMSMMMGFFETSETVLHTLMKDAVPRSLTNAHYKILEYVYFNGFTDISGLADCLYLSLPNASREVRKLIENGYVIKEVDEKDKRRYYLCLTVKGKALMDQIFKKVYRNAEDMYGFLSVKDQLDFADELEKVIKRLLDHKEIIEER